MAEHHHWLLPVEQGLQLRQPLPVATQGQMQHLEGQFGQGQFAVFAHVDDPERLPRLKAPLQVRGGEGAGVPGRFGSSMAGVGGGGVRMVPSC